MSHTEFSDIYDQLEWADRQIDIISHEISAFLKTNPYKITREPYSNGTHDAFYIEMTSSLPRSLTPAVASAVQSQRSALDYLAVALANRNRPGCGNDAAFPFAISEDEFSKKHILKKISKLSPDDQERIKALKPYKGGNDYLFALHWLNIEAKHRRLNAVASDPKLAAIGGRGRFYGIAAFRPSIGANERALVAITQKETDCQFQFLIDVAFCEIAGEKPAVALVPFLHAFGNLTRRVVSMFER